MKINRSTFSILFYINTGKMKKSGNCPIVGRISVDGKSTSFNTGLDILPANWDASSGLVKSKLSESQSINRKIEKYKAEVSIHYKSMLENKGYVTAEMLKNALHGIGTAQNTVMQEFSALVEEKKKSVGIRIEANTCTSYKVAFKHFLDFLQQKYPVDNIPFGKINRALIEDYAYYLKIDLKMMPRTVQANMIPFRATVKRAFNRGLMCQDPFYGYVPEKVKPERRWLSNDEIERIMNVEMEHPAQNFTRDMFIFSTFTGLALIDLKNLKHEHIQQQEDGSLWIVLNRQKTGTASHIPLLDVPVRILGKYGNTEFAGNDGKVFKLQTRQSLNLHLKRIAKSAGIDKRLTFHQSRHSFGTTICLTNGIPIETLSQMMGHKSVKTTQIYAKVTRTKLNEDMTGLEKRIAGKYELSDNQTTNKNI